MNGYLANGDIAPQILFYNGPAATPYTTARDAYYGWSATPTFQINGAQQVLGWSQSSVQSAIDNQLAQPCHLTISPVFEGDASGGTVSYLVTAEEDLVDTQISFWAAIVESHDMASSEYGVYSGQELMWEPRAFPVGTSGQAITFTGPYPQTITVPGSYTLDPTTMSFDNLSSVAFVQSNTASHIVFNASFMDLPDSGTGMGGGAPSTMALVLGPNPVVGALDILSVLPEGETGTISIFDICGRTVREFAAGGASTTVLENPGVYFVRLCTGSGQVITRSCTALR